MKVLHILRMSTYSGAENVACQIINMCTERGIESVYAAPDGAIRNAVEEKGIQFLGLKRISISEIKRAIKETSPDVIHAHDMYVSFLVSLCCGKIPMISHIHNNDLGSRKITLKSVLYLFSSYRAKCIFWVSPSAFEGYHFKEKIKDKSCVLKNIIDIDDVCLKADSDKEFYDYDICFIGRLVSPKDPLRLMRVFSKVCQKVPNVKIAVAGSGEMEEETMRLCAKLGIGGNVDFLGYMSNPYKLLKESKVMVMVSVSEGTPMSALESLALGVPVVSTPTDGLADLVENGVNGYTATSDDELAERILNIITNPTLREELSQNARKKSRYDNNKQNYTDKITEVYERVLR